MMKEFGGYLPFEIKKGNEYYYGDDVVALNCARNAIVYSFLDGGYSKLYLPFYMCYSVMDALRKNGILFETYHINERFEPIGVCLKSNECILYPNYFGLFSDEKIRRIVQRYENVILDNTQAFFSKPIPEVYNVYSCRKFVGVSDGAYVVHKGIKHMEYERDKSYHRMQYLFKAIEEGTNAAYHANLEVEQELCELPIQRMSLVTHSLLAMADYDLIKKRRVCNFEIINHFFSLQEKKCILRSAECVPMIYPLVCEEPAVRTELVKHNIYVPQWWKYLLKDVEINSFEKMLAECLMPLPVDQRYEEADMKEMIMLVHNVLGGTK